MQLNKLTRTCFILAIVAAVVLAGSLTPAKADPGGVVANAGPAGSSGAGLASIAAVPIATYAVGDEINWFASISTNIDLDMWDVSCVPEAVWPARDEGIVLTRTEGYGGTLAAGESAEQDFFYDALEAGQYEIACYFWVNDAFYARLAWLIEVTE
ncbi:MAG: hypothetical protein U0528_11985 [Anaerolineae bacterium]|nr:hypothetical protein [Anaerolineae bacterium]